MGSGVGQSTPPLACALNKRQGSLHTRLEISNYSKFIARAAMRCIIERARGE